ncbi:hypothetical protein L484_014947 [Morus notabilis]|uniref:Uncharacterized protein n=1 Tax=Morus notabilis TaxID=981085 RepID=W9QZG4_9ROSA|nr:hypothetical protein L484_014947 [Morus notabilis]
MVGKMVAGNEKAESGQKVQNRLGESQSLAGHCRSLIFPTCPIPEMHSVETDALEVFNSLASVDEFSNEARLLSDVRDLFLWNLVVLCFVGFSRFQ